MTWLTNQCYQPLALRIARSSWILKKLIEGVLRHHRYVYGPSVREGWAKASLACPSFLREWEGQGKEGGGGQEKLYDKNMSKGHSFSDVSQASILDSNLKDISSIKTSHYHQPDVYNHPTFSSLAGFTNFLTIT